jgi:hypothetical protein
MSVRKASRGKFTAEVGETTYLVVPDGKDPDPSHAIPSQDWFDKVTKLAQWRNDKGEQRGDLLFSVHGYNMSESEVIERHRLLANGLNDVGFKGLVVSFDWPSDDKALAYLLTDTKPNLPQCGSCLRGLRIFLKTKTGLPDEYPCIRTFHRCLCFN